MALVLIIAGLLLLLAELLIPSGVCFVLAVCSVVGGVAVMFITDQDPYLSWLTLVGVFIVLPVVLGFVIRLWPKTPMGKRFFLLAGKEDGTTLASLSTNIEMEQLRGKFGRTLSPLRPSGVTDFDGRRVDTISEGMMVDAGQWVRCIDVQAGKVIVRPVDRPDLSRLENEDFRS